MVTSGVGVQGRCLEQAETSEVVSGPQPWMSGQPVSGATHTPAGVAHMKLREEKVACPRSHSWYGAKPGFEPQTHSNSKAHTLNHLASLCPNATCPECTTFVILSPACVGTSPDGELTTCSLGTAHSMSGHLSSLESAHSPPL